MSLTKSYNNLKEKLGFKSLFITLSYVKEEIKYIYTYTFHWWWKYNVCIFISRAFIFSIWTYIFNKIREFKHLEIHTRGLKLILDEAILNQFAKYGGLTTHFCAWLHNGLNYFSNLPNSRILFSRLPNLLLLVLRRKVPKLLESYGSLGLLDA